MSYIETSGYWERRLMAVNSIEGMDGAVEAVPLLEAILKVKNAKSRVSLHLPRDLDTQRKPSP
jgi:hypothetical protein